MATRIQVLNKRTNLLPEGAVYIGRPSPWGNPFSHLASARDTELVASREEAVARFKEYADKRLYAGDIKWLLPLKDATALVCWCKPLACHGDYLAELLYRWHLFEERL